jgi:hypothetical protein
MDSARRTARPEQLAPRPCTRYSRPGTVRRRYPRGRFWQSAADVVAGGPIRADRLVGPGGGGIDTTIDPDSPSPSIGIVSFPGPTCGRDRPSSSPRRQGPMSLGGGPGAERSEPSGRLGSAPGILFLSSFLCHPAIGGRHSLHPLGSPGRGEAPALSPRRRLRPEKSWAGLDTRVSPAPRPPAAWKRRRPSGLAQGPGAEEEVRSAGGGREGQGERRRRGPRLPGHQRGPRASDGPG